MPKRAREPEEAIGPSIDGNAQIERLEMALRPLPEAEEMEESEPEPEIIEPQVALICGGGEIALASARLARGCGFSIELAEKEAPETGNELANLADAIHVLENYDDLIAACDIDANHYICIFTENIQDCEHILFQCLASDAVYIGAWADKQASKEIFAGLKAEGAPDAELAAICCPMGLGIGAQTPEQDAVAIVAEMLAAHSGVLKRLRYADEKVYKRGAIQR